MASGTSLHIAGVPSPAARWDVVRGGRDPLLRKVAEGKGPTERLFGNHWRDWVRKSVGRICGEVGVPVVGAHSMRGLHSSVAMVEGQSSEAVARAMGHESARTTLESYATKEAVESGQQRRVVERMLNVVPRGQKRKNIVPQSFRSDIGAASRRRKPR